MSREDLFDEMLSLDERYKKQILSRVFGMFEAAESIDGYEATPERFFAIVEMKINEFKKQKNSCCNMSK